MSIADKMRKYIYCHISYCHIYTWDFFITHVSVQAIFIHVVYNIELALARTKKGEHQNVLKS